MKISLYTAVQNGIYYDYHVVAMLKHHLPLADEIIINEGYSSDDTYERICNIDPKIKVFRTKWEAPKDEHWWIHFKDAARRKCTGDWCIHLDCDEFIPEWQFDDIRTRLAQVTETILPLKFTNFYGNYKVYHVNPRKVFWSLKKMIIHRNIEEIEFWGDGANVRLRGKEFSWGANPEFDLHHFGAVRNAARLRQRWYIDGNARQKKSYWLGRFGFLFGWRRHDWFDKDFLSDLELYKGPYIKAVRDDPEEFVRDNLKLAYYLENRQ